MVSDVRCALGELTSGPAGLLDRHGSSHEANARAPVAGPRDSALYSSWSIGASHQAGQARAGTANGLAASGVP